MVVGLVGAFLTAAYMTRCVFLTFYGEYRGHGHPHESPLAITGPLVFLAGASAVVGLLNAPFTDYWFGRFIENEAYFAAGIAHHNFSGPDALLSTVVVLAAITAGYAVYFLGKAPADLTQRSNVFRRGYQLLVNKYYLDDLYERVVVAGIKGPIARAAYWFNQNVLDGVVNGAASVARVTGNWVYRNIDQGVVDGAVNGSGMGADSLGGVLRTMQNGRVQQYGALLFGGTAVLALGLVIFV
jgi:NADH-quinone oxidoreductase subunit L